MTGRRKTYSQAGFGGDFVYIKNCVRLHTKVEHQAHEKLRRYATAAKKDWFMIGDIDLDTIKQTIDDIVDNLGVAMPDVTSNGASTSNAIAAADGVASEADNDNTDDAMVEPDLAKFFHERFVLDPEGATSWADIIACYRSWRHAKVPSKLHHEVRSYVLTTLKLDKTPIVDHITGALVTGVRGITMIPPAPFTINDESSEVERFLHDNCVVIHTGRIVVDDFRSLFAKWKTDNIDPSYGAYISRDDAREFRDYMQPRFVCHTVSMDNKTHQGYYGLSWIGQEHLGRRLRPKLSKPVHQIDPSTGDIVITHPSVTSAATSFGLRPTAISVAVQKGTRVCGFTFQFSNA